MKSIKYIVYTILLLSIFVSCDDFLFPSQDLILKEENVPSDRVEMRAASLGLYALQQELAEQLVILGELRGDLLEVTGNADPHLREIYNFNVSPENRYANPKNFYKLIAASNKVIRILEEKYLAETDSVDGITDYHKMHGEAICMRSWAYFNAARIYNEIPYIPETLTKMDKIIEYVNTPGTYVDSSYIQYHPNGLYNDTIVMVYEAKEKMFLNQNIITRKCIEDIEDRVVATGVDYGRDYDDDSWKVTIWNEYAMHSLLGQMYLHIGDYTKAMTNFNEILFYSEAGENYLRFGLDSRFSYSRWSNILTGLDGYEHIFSLWFGKTSETFQENPMQYYFSSTTPNIHAIKPTKKAVENWETLWRRYIMVRNINNPEQTYMQDPGTPGDYFRGNGISYAYIKEDGSILSQTEWAEMMELKLYEKQNELLQFMAGVDTVVYKYSIGKSPFSHDANLMLYRAAGIHLYVSEIYANWAFIQGGIERNYLLRAEEIIYSGKYKDDPRQLGVSGRVGFDRSLGISIDDNIVYEFDPYTNDVIGYNEINTTLEKQLYLDEIILKERARELAFEGERFYDIVRIAKRRNKRGIDGNEFLANLISSKFKGSQRDIIKERLLNEDNWYIPFKLD